MAGLDAIEEVCVFCTDVHSVFHGIIDSVKTIIMVRCAGFSMGVNPMTGCIRKSCAGIRNGGIVASGIYGLLLLQGAIVFGAGTTLWQIGTADNSYAELAIAGNYSAYSAQFPNDVDYSIGTDSPDADWAYIQPSTSDSWAGSRQHPFIVRFDCEDPQLYVLFQLDLHLTASHDRNPPSMTVDINGQLWHYQTTIGPGDSVLENPSGGNVQTYTAFISPDLLRASGNMITLTTDGSWMLYDAVVFKGFETIPPMTDFEIVPQHHWYRSPDGDSRKFRLDFNGQVLSEPAEVEVVTPGGTFIRHINPEAALIGYAEVLAPMPAGSEWRTVTITLRVGSNAITRAISVAPERQWEIYLIHQTHLDIGYTDTQPNVMNTQINHLHNALDYIDQSRGRPAAEAFKWHPEGMWAVEEFFRRASANDKNRMIQATRDKLIHLDALYAQAMTGIYSEEELFELLGSAGRYSKACGTEINSVIQTDVPGYAWGLAAALGHWGVKYINVGPNSGHRIGHTFAWGDKPFYWISPCGTHKVLFWMAGKGYNWFHGAPVGHTLLSEEDKILAYLDELCKQEYPYDMVNVRYGIGADNGPPNPALPDSVKEWNEKFAYPKLIVAANSEMMVEFERRYGSQLPVMQKDFTPYWEDGSASTAADTGMNRRTSERLVQVQTLWSMLNAAAFPHEDCDLAWQKLIMYDEHTWGAHNSISNPDSAFAVQQAAYKRQFAVDGSRITDELMAGAVAAIHQSETNTIDVFNTLNWPRTEFVCIDASDSTAGNVVKDASGDVVPSQRLSTGELAFLAAGVPALGAKRYTVHSGSSAATGDAVVSGNRIENGTISARWDAQNGALTALTHRSIPADLVDTSVGRGLNDYLYILGRDDSSGHQRINEPITVTILDNGPLVATVKLGSSAPGCNSLSRILRVFDGVDRLFISNTLDKRKVRDPESVSCDFPFNVPDGEMRIDVQWGVMQPEVDQIEGANKNFFCTRRWIDISNNTYGVTWSSLDAPMVLFNPIAFSTGGWDKESYRTFIEPGQAFHSWVMNNHWETNYKADQEGIVTFRYALKPHAGGYDSVRAEQFGRAIHQPLLAVSVNPSRPTVVPLLQIQGDGIVVSTIEPSRDGTALMVRLYNSDAANTVETKIDWPNGKEGSSIWFSSPFEDRKSIVNGPFSMIPFEIVTLRLQDYVSDPHMAVTEETVDFGAIDPEKVSFEKLSITNLGDHNDLLVSSSIVSGDTTCFSVVNPSLQVRPGGSAGMYIKFVPKDVPGTAQAVLEIRGNDPDDPTRSVTLTGRSAPASIYKQIRNPVVVDYSSHLAGYSPWQSIDGGTKEWASNGDGANARITYDFGQAQTVDAVMFQDRLSPSHIDAFSLTFINHPGFDGGYNPAVNFTNADGDNAGLYEFPAQTARYLRFDVVSASGEDDQGIHEIAFYEKVQVSPNVIQSASIATSASSQYASRQASGNVTNRSGLSNDRHDNVGNAQSMWHGIVGPPFGGVSRPNSGSSAGAEWIRFEFDRVYDLREMIVWNHNQINSTVSSPDMTDRGMKDVYVEYSVDGVTYQNLAGEGTVIRFKKAPGMNGIFPTDVIDFNGLSARCVVLTAAADNPNYGGNVIGLSEVRFTADNNPPTFSSNIIVRDDAPEGRFYQASLAADVREHDIRDVPAFVRIDGAAWLEVAEDGVLSGVPAQDDVGPSQVIVQVSDGFALDMAAVELEVLDLCTGEKGLTDFAEFAKYWLECNCGACGGADLDEDYSVNIQDLLRLADMWLTGAGG